MNLEALRQRYRETLPGKIAAIEAGLAQLGSGSPQAAETVRGLAHKLVGSGGSYGFAEITRTARAVEESDESELPDHAAELLEVLRGLSA